MTGESQPGAAPRRTVRSFVRREGRMTDGQREALESLWPRYGIDASDAVRDFAPIFGRSAPLVVEIGFGNGDGLAQMAASDPQHNFLGIEVHRPGVGRLLARVHSEGLRNVRVMCADAVDILTRNIADATLDRVQIFFPDPWPKKRHHKRRLIQPEFVTLCTAKLRVGGILHLATDWQHYAEHMLAVLRAAPGLCNLSASGDYAERPVYRPLTKFEQRGQRLGHGIWDLVFERAS